MAKNLWTKIFDKKRDTFNSAPFIALVIRFPGLCALDGAAADPIAVEIMWQAGIDISAHRARNLSSWMMREADLVFTMDHAQLEFVTQRFPAASTKLARLGDSCAADIPDPFRQGLPAFQHAYCLIERAAQRRLPQLARNRRLVCALN